MGGRTWTISQARSPKDHILALASQKHVSRRGDKTPKPQRLPHLATLAGRCTTVSPARAGEGPWHTPTFPGKEPLAGRPQRVETASLSKPTRVQSGSSLFFWLKLCLCQGGGHPLGPTREIWAERNNLCKTQAKNSSAHSAKAGQAGWASWLGSI